MGPTMGPSAWASAVSAGVAVVCTLIALASLRATRHTGNGSILFVGAAFGLLALKGAVKAWVLSQGTDSFAWEIGFSLVDLAAVSLIAWPLVRTWGRSLA